MLKRIMIMIPAAIQKIIVLKDFGCFFGAGMVYSLYNSILACFVPIVNKTLHKLLFFL
jgi:hypothetical protein